MPDRGGDLPGYSFRDAGLLETALTHRSAGAPHNEGLEFLGDAVVGLAVAQRLFDLAAAGDGAADEGRLTQARARVVSREGLAAAARALDLGARLDLGEGERRDGGAEKDRLLCGAFEAVVGAIFLDGGYPAARDFCARTLGETVADTLAGGAENKDPKNLLQERAQAAGVALPRYSLVATEGADHLPVFEVRVEVGCVAATGVGGSKKEAERAAARAAIETLARHPDLLDGPPAR